MTEYALLTFGSLFAIVDPFAAIPAFLAMTTHDSVDARRRMALTASMTAGFVMVLFAAVGPSMFKLFGITMPAFQIAGGLILLLSSLDMLRAKRTPLKETPEETEAGSHKDDIAITPLAVPMLAGPGALTTAIVLANKAGNAAEIAIFYTCIAVVSAISYAVLWLAATNAKRLSPIALNIMGRLMGLLLAALGVQFIMTALHLK